MEKTDDKKELEEAIETAERFGHVAIPPGATLLFPVIKELSALLEEAGYRVDEAKVEREGNDKATGRIMFSVFPVERLIRLKKEIGLGGKG